MAGQTGAATVTITDPPANTEAAKSATGRSFTWPGPNLTPSETWSSGHRNPYGLTFDAQGRLWETEMGPRGGDELNLILPGKNYGWPNVSEGENYDGVPIAKPATQPQYEKAEAVLGAVGLTDQPADLQRQFVSAVEGQRLHRRPSRGRR